MIKSKTMMQITKTPFLKRLNKALAVSMRLEQSQTYSKPKSHWSYAFRMFFNKDQF